MKHRVMILLINIAVGSTANAGVVVNDFTNSLAQIEIQIEPTSLPGFTRFTFFATPLTLGDEVSSINAKFTATRMRQVGPPNFETIFQDSNFTIELIGESPDNDSQFHFRSQDILSTDATESDTELSATFTLRNSPIQAKQSIANVVLPNTVTGFANIELVVRRSNNPTDQSIASFSNAISFSAVPEPSPAVLLGMLTVAGCIRSRLRKHYDAARVSCPKSGILEKTRP